MNSSFFFQIYLILRANPELQWNDEEGPILSPPKSSEMII